MKSSVLCNNETKASDIKVINQSQCWSLVFPTAYMINQYCQSFEQFNKRLTQHQSVHICESKHQTNGHLPVYLVIIHSAKFNSSSVLNMLVGVSEALQTTKSSAVNAMRLCSLPTLLFQWNRVHSWSSADIKNSSHANWVKMPHSTHILFSSVAEGLSQTSAFVAKKYPSGTF